MIDFHQLKYYIVDNPKAALYGEQAVLDSLFRSISNDYLKPEVFNNENFKHDVKLIKQWINHRN